VRQKNLSIQWTKHLKDKGDKDNFIAYVKNSSSLLEVLSSIMEEKLTEATKSKTTDYESPSWAYRAADLAGYTRALREILDLIELEN
jgi:hypothetical protein